MLLEKLITDEKKIDKELYSSGPYWDYKNSKAIYEIRKKGLSEFRGKNAGIGTSFADNIVHDVRNELNFKVGFLLNFFHSRFLINYLMHN